MAKQTIGNTPGSGDDLRTGWTKANANFGELYGKHEVVAASADRVASAGDVIAADTSAGAWTLTLPAEGGSISVSDPTGDWERNPLTVAGNGATIDGAATMNTAEYYGFAITFQRAASDDAWRYQLAYQYGAE